MTWVNFFWWWTKCKTECQNFLNSVYDFYTWLATTSQVSSSHDAYSMCSHWKIEWHAIYNIHISWSSVKFTCVNDVWTVSISWSKPSWYIQPVPPEPVITYEPCNRDNRTSYWTDCDSSSYQWVTTSSCTTEKKCTQNLKWKSNKVSWTMKCTDWVCDQSTCNASFTPKWEEKTIVKVVSTENYCWVLLLNSLIIQFFWKWFKLGMKNILCKLNTISKSSNFSKDKFIYNMDL